MPQTTLLRHAGASPADADRLDQFLPLPAPTAQLLALGNGIAASRFSPTRWINGAGVAAPERSRVEVGESCAANQGEHAITLAGSGQLRGDDGFPERRTNDPARMTCRRRALIARRPPPSIADVRIDLTSMSDAWTCQAHRDR